MGKEGAYNYIRQAGCIQYDPVDVLAERADLKPRLEFLAPLDPFLWDKALIEALWGFRYSWRYTPRRTKESTVIIRCLVLWGEQLIRRIEAMAGSGGKNGILKAKNLWFTPHPQADESSTAVERTLTRFSKFNNCSGFEVPDILMNAEGFLRKAGR